MEGEKIENELKNHIISLENIRLELEIETGKMGSGAEIHNLENLRHRLASVTKLIRIHLKEAGLIDA